MKLNRTHSILVLAAMFHLLADVAFAGGSVLCVGPNDHAEIEVGHVARDCGPSQEVQQGDVQDGDSLLSIGDASDCIDIPLHADAEMVFEDLSWDLDTPPIVDASFGAARLLERGQDLYIGQATDLTPAMRVHRSIVLLL